MTRPEGLHDYSMLLNIFGQKVKNRTHSRQVLRFRTDHLKSIIFNVVHWSAVVSIVTVALFVACVETLVFPPVYKRRLDLHPGRDPG